MADAIKETAVKITGDATSVSAAMDKASNAVKDGVGKMKSGLDSMEGAFAKVNGVIMGLAAVIGGGAFLKAAMEESSKMTNEANRLSRALGITAGYAGTLNTALGDIYVDADTYIGSFNKFTQALRSNEKGLNEMGLATRDASGNLRDSNQLYREGLELVGKYKPGIDQTAAAQNMFGKSVEDVLKLQRLNNEVLDAARQKNEDLGLTITDQNVQANKEYMASLNDVGDVLTAVKKTVGDAVMPIFTDMANYFASTGPYVIAVFKGALTGLLAVFRTLQVVVKTVMAVVFEAISGAIDQIGNLSNIISSVLSGDFAGAAAAAVAFKDRWLQSFKNIKDAAVDAATTAYGAFSDDMSNMWGPKKEAGKGDGAGSGTKRMGNLNPGKPAQETNRMGEWEVALAERKAAFQAENQLREMSKQAELQYWKDIAELPGVNAKEKLAITKRTATIEMDIMRAQAQEQAALGQLAINRHQSEQLDKLEAIRMQGRQEVELGMATGADMLALEHQLEEQRFAIVTEGVRARLEALSVDPTKNAVALQQLNDELAAIEREHGLRVKGIQNEQQKEQFKDWQGLFQNISQSFANTVMSLVQGTMTWGQAVKSLFQGLLSSVASFIAQMLAKKLAAWAVERTMGAASVATNATVAGSGAAASQAGIPYVGPILAIAAMAAIFAAVMGMGSKIPSAEGGFDIPAGLNPMTQLHEQEMVLPKAEADAIRQMADGGSTSGTVQISGTSAGDFFIAHKSEIVKLMKSLNRNFEFI